MEINLRCPYCNTLLKKDWPNLSFLRCSTCDLLVRNLVVDQQIIDNLYKDSWQKPFHTISETGGTTTELASSFLDLLLKSLKRKSYQDLKILDFGAGRGSMTFALQQAGADIYAIEPYGYEFLKEHGVNVLHDLSEISDSILFDGIVCLDVIEHLPSPWKKLKDLKNLLVPGGWIFVTTPNSKGLNAKIYGSKWREARREGHLLLFSPKNVQGILVNAGYQNIKRLHWNVHYNNSSLTRIKDWLLNLLCLDGELRFIAYKSNNINL